MLRFYFRVLKGPQLHKKFEPRTSRFGDMEVNVSTFPPFPQKLGGHIHSIFCTGYPSDDPQNPEFRESLANSFRDIWHFTVRVYGQVNEVSYTLITESPTNTPSLSSQAWTMSDLE